MKFRLALLETYHNPKFSLAYIFNLSLGLLGFLLLSTFNISVQEDFQTRSQDLLTADLSVSARREILPSEQALIDRATQKALARTQTVEIFSMIASSTDSRLALLIALTDKYPLYGSIQLEHLGKKQSESDKSILNQAKIWIGQDLSIQMALKPQDSLKIGDLTFQVEDLIQNDSGVGWNGFSLAPRLYLGLDLLKKTGLLKPGSTASYHQFFKFSSQKELEDVYSELNKTLTDPGIQITTHQKSGQQMGRMMTYLSDYLSLVGLVGLFLAALGSSFLFHSFISGRLGQIATLISLGLPYFQAVQIYLIQVLGLGLLSALGSIGFSWILLPGIEKLLRNFIDFPIHLRLGFSPIFSAVVVGLGASLWVTLPLILRIRQLKPSILFQESQTQNLTWDRRSLLWALPAVIFFFGLSVWQSHSWKIGSLFFAGLSLSGVFLSGIFLFCLRAFDRGRAQSLPLHLTRQYLIQNPVSSAAAFLAIGLGAILMNILPQIQRSIETEIQSPETAHLPSLFLFDIEDDQVIRLQEFLASHKIAITQLSPMIRARLEAINNRPYEKTSDDKSLTTREEEQETRMRNRGMNLSMREKLSEAESITKGKLYSNRYSGNFETPPEISIEKGYAKTLKVDLGDVLLFDVQGVKVPGRITSFRKVKWTSFQPNFFIQFQPGSLDEAPKTYLATLEKMPDLEKIRIQNEIVKNFPNVSMIDISQLVRKILEAFGQMSLALQAMAALSLLTGWAVLLSITRHQTQTRKTEVHLFKVLGASQNFISLLRWIEFGGLAFSASFLGALISIGLSWGISLFLFDSAWSFSWQFPLGSIVAITFMTLLTTGWATQRTFREKPSALLENSL